jgi:hypothetical protein
VVLTVLMPLLLLALPQRCGTSLSHERRLSVAHLRGRRVLANRSTKASPASPWLIPTARLGRRRWALDG